MKTRRPPAGPGLTVARFLGYGGAALLVSAAVAVLVFQALHGGRGTGASASGTGRPSQDGASTAPAGSAPGTRQTQGGGTVPTRPGTSPGAGSQPGDQGAPMPSTGGGAGAEYCPAGTAVYRAGRTSGVEVAVTVGAAGVVKADVTVAGHGPLSDQASVRKAGTHTFRFAVAPTLVRRVKITTLSVGVDMQTCYARPA
ncbi:hypothetical protein DZF91_28880 [Actinomadura logoneensis]|uniref:Uncharacterized protein n=1 Tax=Actinomadura logoneensis TaxID=2293572 RepID=A0A372JDY6_9ACTN|nr:hypothetical protein [Actinomadura logoneensis]RFU38207.1 hypothetical protein DZF91_28880 [Actinomadura logoneensis]